tara:strand:+ start:4579 stop:5460 length:882 start_codon:yes stop_codon:yes gene_type:complete
MKPGIFGTVYGPSKTGKSVCTGAVGVGGLFIAGHGGLLSVQTFLGVDKLKVVHPSNVEAAAKILAEQGPKHSSVVIDDFSLIVERTVQQLEKVHSGWDMWGALRAQVMRIRDVAREVTVGGTHVLFNCHESPPRTSSGKFVRGGPALPGQLPEQFSTYNDIVARVVYEDTAEPWKYVFSTKPDAQYVAGDRLSIFPAQAPMNLAEAMRAAGYKVARPKGLSWQEKVVDGLATKIQETGLEHWREVLKPAAKTLSGKYSIPHVRWALQDGLHRAVLAQAKQNSLEDLFKQEDAW